MAFPFIAGGAKFEGTTGISTFNDGSSILAGRFQDTVSFGGTNLTSTGDHNEDFIAKLDNNGNYLWVKQFTATQYIALRALNTLSDGSSIVSGSFKGTASFGATNLTNAGDHYEGYIAKLDSNGNNLWVKHVTGTQYIYPTDVSNLSDGSSIISGYFRGTASFGATNLTSAGDYDSFVAKLDSNGNYLWAKRFGGTEDVYTHNISTFSDGSFIVGGRFEGTANFGGITLTEVGSTSNGFTAKFDSDGNNVWATPFRGSWAWVPLSLIHI